MVVDTVTRVRRYSFTVDEFAKMGEAGIFTEDDRVELIDGEVRDMVPIGPRDAAIVNRLTVTLVELLKRTAILQVQNPVRLDSHNEPQPDFSVVSPRDDYYENSLPEPGDTLLVIEVADSSLAYDLHEKTPQFAKSMIPELWLVDLEAEVVRVFAQPGPSGYASERVMRRGSTIASASVKGLLVGVNDIFG